MAADVLGLQIVRRLDASMFGAALVESRDGTVLVLKASTDLKLAPEWATGAAMAARLRELGYPASRYLETGTADTVIWSLQEVLPGSVPRMFTVGHAEQLLAFARRHDIDSGMRRPWDADARDISRHALADLAPLPNAFDETLRSVLDRTQDVVLEQTTIVHGDFHHRNIHVDSGRVVGVPRPAGEWPGGTASRASRTTILVGWAITGSMGAKPFQK